MGLWVILSDPIGFIHLGLLLITNASSMKFKSRDKLFLVKHLFFFHQEQIDINEDYAELFQIILT